MKVSEGTLGRALQVMAQVLAVLERQGTSIEISDQGHTTALINGEHVSFGIEEPIGRIVTQKPRVPNPADQWDYDKVVKHEPGGKLVLVIHSATSESPFRNIRQKISNKTRDIQVLQSLAGFYCFSLVP